jgi:hypothetical protein
MSEKKRGRPAGVTNTICGRVIVLVDGEWVTFEMRERYKRTDGTIEPGGIYVRKFHARRTKTKHLSFADACHTANGQKLLPI